MKKRLGSILLTLALALALALLPCGVLPAQAAAQDGKSPGTAYVLSGADAAEAWDQLKQALGENGLKRTDGEDAQHPTHIRLAADCADGTRSDDSFLELGYGRYVVLDLNGKRLDRGLGNAESCLNCGQVIRFNDAGKGALTIDDSAGNGVITGGYGRYGGGIFLSSNGVYEPALTLRGGTITGNRSDYFGGGVYMEYGALTLAGGAISRNAAASYDGGGIYCYNNVSAVTIESGRISDNTAGRCGGGIFCGTGSAVLTINGGAITGNTAADGGGVYSQMTTMMNGGEISGNEATSGNGGGEWVARQFTLNGGEIKDNTAARNGGGIWSDARLTLDGGVISGNNAVSGGGVYADVTSLLTLTGCRISGNGADSGGGVYKRGFTRDNTGLLRQFVMTGGEISGNDADVGGGVYLNLSVFTMTGGRITGNNAGSGGGVYHDRKVADEAEQTSFNLSGSPVITGNVSGGRFVKGVLTGGTANNVLLLTSQTQLTVTGALTDKARIGVTCGSTLYSTMIVSAAADYGEGLLTAADAARFSSDLPTDALGLIGGAVWRVHAMLAKNDSGDFLLTARHGSVLLLAEYDENGRMTAFQKGKTLTEDIVEARLAPNALKSLGITYPAASAGTMILILADGGTWAPLIVWYRPSYEF